jgi:hypothetical protein
MITSRSTLNTQRELPDADWLPDSTGIASNNTEVLPDRLTSPDAATDLVLGKLLATQQRAIEARKMLENAERFFNQQANVDGLAQARKALLELK